jgi:hypothetical protein
MSRRQAKIISAAFDDSARIAVLEIELAGRS